MLRLKNGKQCCLGFVARVLGYKAKEITGHSMPEDTEKELPGLTLFSDFAKEYVNSDFSDAAARVNDKSDIAEKDRERQLKTLARNNGFLFQFIN